MLIADILVSLLENSLSETIALFLHNRACFLLRDDVNDGQVKKIPKKKVKCDSGTSK